MANRLTGCCIPFTLQAVCKGRGWHTGPYQNHSLLKKAAAILLIGVFAWSHYVRQVIYLECRLAGSFKSFGVVCDCEKKAGLSNTGTNNLPLPAAHAHIHPDELFPFTRMIQPYLQRLVIINKRIPLLPEKTAEGWYARPFQPPRCC